MNGLINRLIIVLLLTLSLCTISNSEIVERVVAYVDDYAITLSDVREAIVNSKVAQRPFTELEAIEALINRALLLREAKKMKIEGQESDQINEYIEIKIKSLIFIKDEEIQGFYEANQERFKGVALISVKDKIEKYLLEQETNKRLIEHLKELRERADIRVQFAQ